MAMAASGTRVPPSRQGARGGRREGDKIAKIGYFAVGDGPEPNDENLEGSGLLDRFQQLFSLFQIRLVGAILIGYFFLRVALLLALAAGLDPFMRLSQLSTLANSAIMLPLGCALYLLGSGYRRQAIEKPLLKVLFPLLLPLAIVVGVLLPLAIVSSTHTLQQQQQDASRASQVMLDENRRLERRMANVPNVAAAKALIDVLGLPMPLAPGDPMPLVRWRFAQVLQQRHATLLEQQPLARITAYQQELLGMGHMITTFSLSVFAGGSLLLLFLQGRNRFRRYHISSSTFLTSEAVKPRHRNR